MSNQQKANRELAVGSVYPLCVLIEILHEKGVTVGRLLTLRIRSSFIAAALTAVAAVPHELRAANFFQGSP